MTSFEIFGVMVAFFCVMGSCLTIYLDKLVSGNSYFSNIANYSQNFWKPSTVLYETVMLTVCS